MKIGHNRIFSPDIVLVILSTLIVWWGNSTITPFLPLLAKSIHFSLIETSIFLGVMGIARFLAQPFLGKILSFSDEKLVIRLIFLMLFLSSLGYLFSNNFYFLILCRIIEAIAFASFAIAVRIVINTHFNFKKISLVNNYYSGAQNLGRFIGPALAGFVIAGMGIKFIFLITCILYLIGSFLVLTLTQRKSTGSSESKIEIDGSIHIFKKSLIIFLLLYTLEFIGLGLWLSGWSIYAINTLNWDTSMIGISFSVLAISSIMVIPFLNRILSIQLQKKIIIGILLLSVQPLTVLIFKETPWIMWLSFVLGGAGATLYFSTFHSYVAKCLQGKQVAIFYGFVGSFSFAGQAIGQVIAPFLSHFHSDATPILFDFLVLMLDLVCYLLFFLTIDPLKNG